MKSTLFNSIRKGLSFLATNYTWGFIIIISISAISGIFSIHYINTLENEFRQIFEYDVNGRNTIQNASSLILLIDVGVKDLMIYRDTETRQKLMANLKSNMTSVENLLENSRYRFIKSSERKLYLQSKLDLENFLAMIKNKINEEPPGDDLNMEFINRIDKGKETILSDFSRLNILKRNSITIVFNKIKIQLGTSLAFTIMLLIATIVIRLVMYLNGRENKNHKKINRKRHGIDKKENTL